MIKSIYVFIIFLLSIITPLLVSADPSVLGLGINAINGEYYMRILHQDDDAISNVEYPTTDLSISTVVIDHMLNYTQSSSLHIEGSTKFKMIKLSASLDYKKIHNEYSKKSHTVALSHADITVLKNIMNIENVKLADGFRDDVYKGTFCLQKNFPPAKKENNLAIYYANKILREYGTHIIFSETLGATIDITTTINRALWQGYSSSSLKVSADTEIGKFLKMKGSYESKTSERKLYNESITQQKINHKGGESWHQGWSYNDWSQTVKDHPIVVSKRVVPIIELITPYNFRNTTNDSIEKFRDILNYATKKHIDDNTQLGCMDPESSNFSPIANVHDITACNFKGTFNFGGVYQTSTDNKDIVKNVITQKTSCPSGYTSYPISSIYDWDDNHEQCFQKCKSPNDMLKRVCIELCKVQEPERYQLQAFQCITLTNTGTTNGVFFGGIYSNKVPNYITGSIGCPSGYTNQVLYHNVHICLAPYDSGKIYKGVSYGGIFSSSSINPYTDKFVCPSNYERHTLGNILPTGSRHNDEIVSCIGYDEIYGSLYFKEPGYGESSPIFTTEYQVICIDENNQNCNLTYIVNIDSIYSYQEQYNQISDYEKKLDNNHIKSPSHLISNFTNNNNSNDPINNNISMWILGAVVGVETIIIILLLYIRNNGSNKDYNPIQMHDSTNIDSDNHV